MNYIIVFNGTISSEEVIHHWQTREVLSEIVKSNLIEKLEFPYSNKSNKITIHQYELFDKTTKNFVLHFKNDIQKIVIKCYCNIINSVGLTRNKVAYSIEVYSGINTCWIF